MADLTQARWDEYIRAQDDIKQSTLKAHLRVFTSLIRHHGLALGAPLIPEFDHVAMPKSERAERQDTITDEQFEAHKHRLLYPFVIVMAASGMRPDEAAGLADKSLRLRNLEEIPGYSVDQSADAALFLSVKPGQFIVVQETPNVVMTDQMTWTVAEVIWCDGFE